MLEYQLFYPHSYVAPIDGLYLATASVKIQDGSLTDSAFLMTIAIDGNPSTFNHRNGMQDYIEYRFAQASK